MGFSIETSDHLASENEIAAIHADPGFAVHASDHMASARWSNGEWTDLRIHPFEPIKLDPRAMALHYGQEIFEGLKAFAIDDGSVAMFRPEENAKRFVLSAERMAMAPLPVEVFIDACEELIRIDQRWIPTTPGSSFYLRPFMYASEPHIGVRAALEFSFSVIALPTAPFFSATFDAITVGVVDQYVRAAKGGTGEAKCAGNYAASLLAKQQVVAMGCAEVLWLDAKEHRYVEELSGMNLFFVEHRDGMNDRLVTPPLNGTILRGVTRESLLQLCATLGYETEEREITIDELETRTKSGEISEAFACGTAAVIAPIGRVKRRDQDEIVFGSGKPGETTTRLYDELVDIQKGRSELFPEWRHIVSGASMSAAESLTA